VKKIILATAVALIGCGGETTSPPKCEPVDLTFEDISCVPGPNCKYGTYATDWLNGACIKAKLGSGRDCDSYRLNYILTINECEE
jgi:hypothetical protein